MHLLFWTRISRGSLVKMVDFHPMSLCSVSPDSHESLVVAERASGQNILPCASKSPTLVPRYLGTHVRALEQRSQLVHLEVLWCYWSMLIMYFNVLKYDLIDVHIWSYYRTLWFVILDQEICMSGSLCVTVMYLKHVLKQWIVQIFGICTCDWCWYDFGMLLVIRSTAVALCNYNENTFMCSYMVCTCANTFAMLCICRELYGVSVLWSKAWRWQ